MNNQDTILIVDDELQIRRLLQITLSAQNYKLLEAVNGKEALQMAASHQPSMIILDLGLPDIDGQQVLRKLREWYFKPILILSVRNLEEDIVEALDHGANDYLSKPFRTRELQARIRASLRLNQSSEDRPIITLHDLSLDIVNHVVKKRGEVLKLTTTEYNLLILFAKNMGCVLTHQYILKEIWGYSYSDETQYLRVFVAQLRKKIEDEPTKPKLLITESGIGYRFGM